jgi:hypothetical protein
VAAAGQTATGIRDYYQNLKGNAHGLPVLHVAVNMEDLASYQSQTETFIAQHRFDPVCNDYVRSNNVTYNDGFVRLQLQPSNQRPVFAVINGVANSPTHAQWQLLVNQGSFGETDFSQEIAAWRTIIDSVKAPAPRLAPPAIVSNQFQFTLPAQRGQTNRVEVSSNLREWSVVTNLIGTNATVTLREPAAPGDRFYRVVRP